MRINNALTYFRLKSETNSDALENNIIKDARDGLLFLICLKSRISRHL